MSSYVVSKADINRALEKVRSGLYQWKADPKLTVELHQGRGFRHWYLQYDGCGLGRESQEFSLEGVLTHWLPRLAPCEECSAPRSIQRTRQFATRHGIRRVCPRCHEELRSLENALRNGRLAAERAVATYDAVLVAREAPSAYEATLRLIGRGLP